jgi:hypothetical protein
MSNSLKVGDTIQLYTKCETIAGVKVKVASILAYSECDRQNYDLTALAINERVISYQDEKTNLKTIIDGNGDNIYLCRAVDSNSDNSYAEYVVWDGIINYEKTKSISSTYVYNLNIKLLDSTNVPITTVISGIEKFLKNNYAATIDVNISESTSTDGTEQDAGTISDANLSRVEGILNKLASFENRLIPAAEKITNANLSENIEDIISKVDTINRNVSVIANNV